MSTHTQQTEIDRYSGKTAKRFTIRLSLAGLLSTVAVAVLSFLWVFIMGVLVGRGYQPEEAVSQLTSLLPSTQSKLPDTLPEALRPEELEFDKNLSQQAGISRQNSTRPPSSPVTGTPDPTKTQQMLSSAPSSRTALSATEQIPQGPVHTYIYQCASFRDNAIARAFQIELDNHNLQSSLEEIETETGLWYRILVTFTGTAQETEKVKQILAELGIQNPLLKKKTPL